MKKIIFFLLASASSALAGQNTFKTNCCEVTNAPSWLSNYKIQSIASQMETDMGWSIRRVKVIFHDTDVEFQKAGNLNFSANAFFSAARQTIEFKPQKDIATFTPTFRHELTHVISNQKYQGGIPAWLEEGFANFIGSKRKVDYKWLAKQNLPDASSLGHPQTDSSGAQMHYQLSTATVDMLAKKCNLRDLLMLTTGSKLTSYLETYCKIKDINSAVRDWVKSKA